jgi:hypothetical protein
VIFTRIMRDSSAEANFEERADMSQRRHFVREKFLRFDEP